MHGDSVISSIHLACLLLFSGVHWLVCVFLKIPRLLGGHSGHMSWERTAVTKLTSFNHFSTASSAVLGQNSAM